MTLRPFFSYYGSKWRAGVKYPPPRFPTIIEPFAGAAGYATRYYHLAVHLIDKDPVIVDLWKWLIEANACDILALPNVKPDTVIAELDAPAPAKTLIAFWSAHAQAYPPNTPSAWFASDERPNSYWGDALKRVLANQIHLVDHWTVELGEYHQAPDIEACWFIDPPYACNAGTKYRHGSQAIDFEDVARFCRERRGQVMVCENGDATWLPFRPLAKFRAQSGHTSEYVWTRGTGLFD